MIINSNINNRHDFRLGVVFSINPEILMEESKNALFLQAQLRMWRNW